MQQVENSIRESSGQVQPSVVVDHGLLDTREMQIGEIAETVLAPYADVVLVDAAFAGGLVLDVEIGMLLPDATKLGWN